MINRIYISGIIGEEVTLMSVISQVRSLGTFEGELEVVIDSVGGHVEVGEQIYSYLKGLENPIKTIAKRAYSIAAHIFMAGDVREVEEGEEVLMIHMPFVQNATGRRKDLESIAKSLKAIEDDFVKFYSGYIKTDISTVRSLLENETFISGSEAVDLGLATSLIIPFKAVAFYSESTNQTDNQNIIMKNVDKLMAALKSFVSTEEKTEVVALVLQDANGVEINFTDVEDSIPEVGDHAEIEGSPAEGEYVSPEGATWIFEKGELKEIKPAEEVEEDEKPEGEVEVETEVETEAVAEEEEISFEELLEQLFAKAKEGAKAEMAVTIEAMAKTNESLSAEVVSLKKLIGSDELNVETNEKLVGKKEKGAARAAQILNARKR